MSFPEERHIEAALSPSRLLAQARTTGFITLMGWRYSVIILTSRLRDRRHDLLDMYQCLVRRPRSLEFRPLFDRAHDITLLAFTMWIVLVKLWQHIERFF